MANPTFDQLFGTNGTVIAEHFPALNINNPANDARLACWQIVNHLQTRLAGYVAGVGPLASYSIAKETENIDIDTQSQVFTITFNMKIAATTVEDEPA